MFNGTLKVGKEYELNNGGVCECVLGTTPNPVLNGVMYSNDGSVWHSGPDHPLSVRGPAVGTLEELDVKPGDVASFVDIDGVNRIHTIKSVDGQYKSHEAGEGSLGSDRPWRIISRAEHTNPTLFRDMTDAEKGALLLAGFNGQEVQKHLHGDVWGIKAKDEKFYPDIAYQIKPEPTTETRTLYMGAGLKNALKYGSDNDAYKLHFDVIEGRPCNPRFEAIE